MSNNSKYLKVNSNIISMFYIMYLVIFLIIFAKYIPNFYSVYETQKMYKSKREIKYFSEYFSEIKICQVMIKNHFQFLLSVTQILFFISASNLSSLIKQRISVPERNHQKGKYFLLVFILLLQSFSMFFLTFFYKISLFATKKYLCLTDNIFFLVNLISTYMFCVLLNYFLLKIEISKFQKESYYLNIKKYLLVIMGITMLHYFICLLLISYYNPVIYFEKFVMSALIVCKEINSILYLLCFILFVNSMKYDFFYMYLDLNSRPDLDYFIEEEERAEFIK